MTIRYSRKFAKQLSKQSSKTQVAVKNRLRLFAESEYDPLLRNHALSGRLKGLSSINITGDIRAIYEVIDGEMYLFVMIGSHSQLYG